MTNKDNGGPASYRELLEMAAKAIGLTLRYNYLGGRDANQPWNPLTDDGDALRLAVALCINIEVTESDVYACTHGNFSEPSKPDRNAATRRAIVRAAAAIGSAM